MQKNIFTILPGSSEPGENGKLMSRAPELSGGKFERGISESTPQPTIDLMVAPTSSLEWADELISLSHSGQPQAIVWLTMCSSGAGWLHADRKSAAVVLKRVIQLPPRSDGAAKGTINTQLHGGAASF